MRDPDCGWDFTPVIDLIHSFAIPGQDANVSSNDGFLNDPVWDAPENDSVDAIDRRRDTGKRTAFCSLGDFETLWTYIRSSSSPSSAEELAKSVRWRDEKDGADLADNDENDGEDWLEGLTKKQRKKARRKARRNALGDTLTNGQRITISGSESETEPAARPPPDRKALIHRLLDRPLPTSGESNGQIHVLRRPKQAQEDGSSIAKPKAAPRKLQEENGFALAAAKKAQLVSKLKERFTEERSYLTDPSMLQHINGATSKDHEGLHVFVDASNIIIGFHNAIKVSRSLPLSSRMQRQPISFHSLSLILSRGRPTSKRVVVGSDNFPEMAEAKVLGYETSILDRVHKAKELTPRQKRYANRENGATHSAGSGSETTAMYAPEKWVEQAVDEILHLKMMESLVDAAAPATMVLATGDAAEAEYSGGFLRMVERALAKGWRVELACWKHNMSASYTRKAFRRKWGDNFKVIELDDFVNLLLGAA